MRKAALCCLVMVGSACLARADYGWTSYSTGVRDAAGSIYSQQENRDVSLDKEAIRFTRSPSPRIDVTFLFTNGSDTDVTVDAAFPVRVSIPRVASAERDAYGGKPEDRLLAFRYDGIDDAASVRRLSEALSVLGDAGIRLHDAGRAFDERSQYNQEFDFSEGAFARPHYFFVRQGSVVTRRVVQAEGLHDPFDFQATQDGVSIRPDSAILESRLGSTGLDLYWHYGFQLSFKARSSAVIQVTYAPASVEVYGEGNSRSASYVSGYILGTGRTWRGPIGRIYLLVPAGSKVTLPAGVSSVGAVGDEDAYLASGYEPAENDELLVGYSLTLRVEPPHAGGPPGGVAQDFVTVRGASSFLKGTTQVTFEGGWGETTYGPANAFDGSRVGGWVEGAKGDGVGEWIELELARDVAGVRIQNGFTSGISGLYGGALSGYNERNRVRDLELQSADGKVKQTIRLADTPQLQSFRDVTLPRGRYKLFIRSVYKGTSAGETALGEITFWPLNTKFASLLQEDEFLRGVY